MTEPQIGDYDSVVFAVGDVVQLRHIVYKVIPKMALGPFIVQEIKGSRVTVKPPFGENRDLFLLERGK